MMARLLLLFTVVPAVELFLLLKLAETMGALETVLLILVTGGLGAWLAKREGLNVLVTLSQELSTGIPPAGRLAEGALVVAGGILLITPGVLTDLTGFALILPPTRRLLAPMLVRFIMARVKFASFTGGDGPAGGPPRPGEARPNISSDDFPFDHPVA